MWSDNCRIKESNSKPPCFRPRELYAQSSKNAMVTKEVHPGNLIGWKPPLLLHSLDLEHNSIHSYKVAWMWMLLQSCSRISSLSWNVWLVRMKHLTFKYTGNLFVNSSGSNICISSLVRRLSILFRRVFSLAIFQ